jgi:hypothetical protein
MRRKKMRTVMPAVLTRQSHVGDKQESGRSGRVLKDEVWRPRSSIIWDKTTLNIKAAKKFLLGF